MAVLTEKLSNLKHLPGVYLFKNAEGAVIYIGKAKALKKRVSSYFQKDHKDWKTDLLLHQIADFEYILTKNETEALLLEAQLIQQHKPEFNVLLKNGNPFLYIVVTGEKVPSLQLVRRKTIKGTYFGPFLNKSAARSAYKYLLDTFKLHLCNQKIAQGCLKYHLGLCTGTCMETFDIPAYMSRIEVVKAILQGQFSELANLLKKSVRELSERKEFEHASRLHEQLQHIDTLIETIKLHFTPRKFDRAVNFALERKPSEQLIDPTICDQLQELLELETKPITIDCFDISHFQSSALVGSCVRFSYGIADKSKFRRFRIQTLTEQNDYAALAEIVARRYRIQSDAPDLIVIDGGKGQLHAVQHLLPNTTFVSLAKREEMIFSDKFPYGLKLDLQSSVGRMLIALRDYTHHFAISYHRKKRADNFKAMTQRHA